MYNKVILVGRLTRDIELRYSQNGGAIANASIATNHNYTSNGEKKEEVCYTDLTFFGRSGEIANQYLRKGSQILVEGRLKFDQWVDQNGQKRSKHSVIVETMKMMDSKAKTEGGEYNNAPAQGGQTDYQQPAQQQQSYQAPQQQQQQQSYQAPQQQQSYENVNKVSSYNQQANTQSRRMPSPDSVPVIDIDEDEIPF